MTTGIRSRHVKAKFLQHVTDEQAHADQLVRRIIHLGSKPDLSPEWLLNGSHAEPVEGDSVREMVTADLLAERNAIDSYRAMIASIGADDPTTRVILKQILALEEAAAGTLVGLLSAVHLSEGAK
jgi:bacterioferritin